MKNIYKYGFWTLIIISISLFNIWRITKSNFDDNINKTTNILNHRINNLFNSNIINERNIKPITAYNVLNDEVSIDLFNDKTLVILLSSFKCGMCQENELKRLKILKNRIEFKKINIIGLTTYSKKKHIKLLIENLNINFPMYYVNDNIFFEDLSFNKDFPQILVIEENIIISAFLPLIMDDAFSEMFYLHFASSLKENKNKY